MTTKPDHAGHPGYGALPGNYGWYPAEAADAGPASRVSRPLWAVVVVLGAASFGVGLGSTSATGFPVRLAVLAAVISAVGLLPGQVGRGWIVVAFAVTGLLDAVATWATASGSGWALPVIVVLNALQSLASLGALLSENGTIRSRSGDAQDYAAYANFVAAYQQYVTQYQQGSMPYYAAARAGAVAEAAAEMSAADTGDAAQESEALRARYAQYDAYTTAENNAGNSAGGPTSFVPRDPGLPGAIRGGPRGQRQRVERERSGETSST